MTNATISPESLARRDTVTSVQLRLALLCVLGAVLGGGFTVLHYFVPASQWLDSVGLKMQTLRPLHTTLASTWIFGGSIAVMYYWLAEYKGGLTRGDMRRFWFHTAIWVAAGIGIMVSLNMRVYSGREYVGFHPIFSLMLISGWFAFAWTFLKRVRGNFFQQPVYVWLWTIGVCYFIFTFIETHAYLLPSIFGNPVRDIALQFKSCGTLVGSFNMLIYGTLMFVGEKISGDKNYAQSKTAFWLFGIGCLNSFTNYVHHTYHLPQGHLMKWIAFVVSMAEAILFFRVMYDLAALIRKAKTKHELCGVIQYFNSVKWWTLFVLFNGVLISIPSLNSLVHGTQVIVGHAMGTELGVDSMALFGAITFLLCHRHRGHAAVRKRLNSRGVLIHLAVMNTAMVVLVTWLTVAGLAVGITRYNGEAPPAWVAQGLWIFPASGFVLAITIILLFLRWFPLTFRSRVAPSHDEAEASPPSVAVES